MNCISTKAFLMMIIQGLRNNSGDGYDNITIIIRYFDNNNNIDSSNSSLKVDAMKQKVQSIMKTNPIKANKS